MNGQLPSSTKGGGRVRFVGGAVVSHSGEALAWSCLSHIAHRANIRCRPTAKAGKECPKAWPAGVVLLFAAYFSCLGLEPVFNTWCLGQGCFLARAPERSELSIGCVGQTTPGVCRARPRLRGPRASSQEANAAFLRATDTTSGTFKQCTQAWSPPTNSRHDVDCAELLDRNVQNSSDHNRWNETTLKGRKRVFQVLVNVCLQKLTVLRDG